jgi:hypothetical protein
MAQKCRFAQYPTLAALAGAQLTPCLLPQTASFSLVKSDHLPTQARDKHKQTLKEQSSCYAAGANGEDNPPVAPLPVDMADQHKDIYGKQSFPAVDGVNVWPFLMNTTGTSPTDYSAAHPAGLVRNSTARAQAFSCILTSSTGKQLFLVSDFL